MVTSPASSGLLVGFRPEIEQVGEIALQLCRLPSRWSTAATCRPRRRAGAPRDRGRNRRQARARCPGRWSTAGPSGCDRVRAAAAKSRASRFEPRPFERQRDLVDQVVEQVELAGRDRPGAVVAGKADRGEHRRVRTDRIEDPFGGADGIGAAPGRLCPIPSPRRRRRCRLGSAGSWLGRAATICGSASPAISTALQSNSRPSSRQATSPICSSLERRQQAAGKAGDGRVARGAGLGGARAGAHPRRELAGDQRDQEQQERRWRCPPGW